MTDRDAKKLKGKESPRPRGLVSQQHERGAAAIDPFDDDGLDEVLEKALGEAVEPRLVIADRYLTGTRIRREV